MSVRSQFFFALGSHWAGISVKEKEEKRDVERMMGSRALNWIAPLGIYAGNL